MEDVNILLKDLTNYDPHFRQNAVRFLSNLFLEDAKRNALKDDDKTKIVTGLLSRLDVKEDSLEVKGCTVKHFGLISKHLKENEIIQIFSKIIKYITEPKAVGKDIYVTCIKAILKEMSGSSCYTVGKVIIPEILKGIISGHSEIEELCFDTFTDYLSTFNYVLIKESESVISNKDVIFSNAIEKLGKEESLTNRISAFLGNFSTILNKNQMSLLLEKLLNKITNSRDISHKISLVNVLNSVSKNTAQRHADYLKPILAMVFEFCSRGYLEGQMSETDNYDLNNDLVQNGLALIETYILKLSNLMKGRTEEIVKNVLELIEFDPNFVYSEEEQEEVANDWAYEGYEGYEAFVFGDDSSWKVRRAAVRVISAFVKSRVEISRNLLELIIESLVFNSREHEEMTKLDILSCLSSFLRNLVIEEETSLQREDSLGLLKQKSVTDFIPRIISQLVERIIKELKGKSSKVKSAVLQLLSSLALVDPNDLFLRVKELHPLLQNSMQENLDILTIFVFFTRLLKSLKDLPGENSLLDDFLSWLSLGIKSDYFKINIESVNMSYHLVRLYCENNSSVNYISKIEIILNEIMPKFKSNDVDGELKSALISTFGNIIIYAGDSLSCLKDIFDILLDKTKNENLRPLVFTTIIKIIKTNKNIDFSPYLTIFIPLILDLLPKHVLHLQYQTLEFLLTILNRCPTAISGYENKMTETLLNMENEDSLLSLIYDILHSMTLHFKLKESLLIKTLQESLKVLENTNLTFGTLNSVFKYFNNVCNLVSPDQVKKFSQIDLNKMDHNKAKSLSIIGRTTGLGEEIISVCVENLSQNKNSSSLKKRNAMILLGEAVIFGDANIDYTGLLLKLQNMLISADEDVKHDLAVCIGKVAAREQKHFISKLSFGGIDILAYTFISIREFLHIFFSDEKTFVIDSQYAGILFDFLLDNSNNDDEKLRLICGENLGMLSLLNEQLLNNYISAFSTKIPSMRATLYYGLKYVFNSKREVLNNKILETLLNLLVQGLSDSDLLVKQGAFNSLINFAHNFGFKVKALYSDIFFAFKREYLINPELISTLDIGGIVIRNDKGLPIRKAIYSTIKIFLDCIPEKINVTETLQICLYGIEDHDDIQALCHGCLLKISHLAPEAFISILDVLLDSCKKKLDAYKGITKGKADEKKIADLIVNTNRLFTELKKVQEIEENPKFIDMTNELAKFI
jgi:hypothetical protein